jgi:hypothetical protein
MLCFDGQVRPMAWLFQFLSAMYDSVQTTSYPPTRLCFLVCGTNFCGSTQLGTWRGHLPITYEILLPILKRAAAGANDFSRAERILYTTCEFWAAVGTRSMVAHLGSEVVDNLESAIFAFSAIGAEHVENTLNAVFGDLAKAPTVQGRLECLAALEDDLSNTHDPVDELIACFARDLKESSAVCVDWLSSIRTESHRPGA